MSNILLKRNFSIPQIAEMVRRREIARDISRPKSPLDTYNAIKALYQHVTNRNIYQTYFTAVRAVCAWNWKNQKDKSPLHNIYVNRAGRKGGYTLKSLKKELKKSLLTARYAEIYDKIGLMPSQVKGLSKQQVKKLYIKNRKQLHSARQARFNRAMQKRADQRLQNRVKSGYYANLKRFYE